MYQAYRKQTSGKLSDEEALQLVFDRIEEAKIWIPDYEILNRYRAKKNQFRKRLAGESVPQHIFVMESILEKSTQKMDALEKKIAEYEAFQAEIQKLEAYYTSSQWKADFAADEAGQYPDKLKRGVLSEEGIWNMLERNRELLERIGIQRIAGEG
jgi:glycogen debranching enzyme